MIAVIGMVKNSADIIETFIRGNSTFADIFVLLDNMSTDNTVPILEKLIAEGYPIRIIKDPEPSYCQSIKMNALIKRVMQEYNPDMIIPLDDDEILITANSDVSPKDILSKLDSNKLHYVKWRIYIPTEDDDINETCVAKRMKMCFADSLETANKVIIPRHIAVNNNVQIVQGNHDVIGNSFEKNQIQDLRIAHFPCRSKEQIVSKAMVGWTNYLTIPHMQENNGVNWKRIYETVTSHREITIEMMWEICATYLSPTSDEMTLDYKPLCIPDNCFIIKYTSKNEVDIWDNYIKNTEQLALKIAELYEKNG